MFDNKVIAITGAGSGIGRALALNLAGRGAVLALADKDADGLAETKRLLGNRPASITALDVTDTAALNAWVAGAVTDFGKLDGIINNAGLSVVAPFADCPEADFDRSNPPWPTPSAFTRPYRHGNERGFNSACDTRAL